LTFLSNWPNFFQNWPNFFEVLAGKQFRDLATLVKTGSVASGEQANQDHLLLL
jgi:hypothetical protein